jgi:hypothetical protein
MENVLEIRTSFHRVMWVSLRTTSMDTPKIVSYFVKHPALFLKTTDQ